MLKVAHLLVGERVRDSKDALGPVRCDELLVASASLLLALLHSQQRRKRLQTRTWFSPLLSLYNRQAPKLFTAWHNPRLVAIN